MKKNFNRGAKAALAGAVCALLFTGCGDSREDFVITNNNPQQQQPLDPVDAPPVAQPDTVVALGNATLNQAAANGVLVNDTLNGGEITDFDATTTQGGTVDLEADGSFTYTPVFGFEGTDRFTYTLANAEGESTTTVTLNVNGSGWFVDNSAAAGGNGSQATPFNSLELALAEAESGDTVFVFRGNGTATNNPFTLPQGVKLIGQAEGLVLAQTIVPGNSDQRPTVAGPITLAGNNEVAGLSIVNNSGADHSVKGENVSGITLRNNNFGETEENHIFLQIASGTVQILDNEFDDAASGNDSIVIFTGTESSAVTDVAVSGNTFTGSSSRDQGNATTFAFRGTSSVELTISGNVINNPVSTSGINSGFTLFTEGTATVNASISDNEVRRVRKDGVRLFGDAASTVTATLSGNMIEDVGLDGIVFLSDSAGDFVATVSQNIIAGSGSNGIEFDSLSEADNMVVTVDNNSVSDSQFSGIYAFASSASERFITLITNNTVEDSGLLAEAEDVSISIDSSTANVWCVDMENNTVNDDIVFDDSTGTNNIDVEQFTILNTINNLTGGAEIVPNPNGGAQTDVTSVPNGTCQGLLE
jgi:hypothetical protein